MYDLDLDPFEKIEDDSIFSSGIEEGFTMSQSRFSREERFYIELIATYRVSITDSKATSIDSVIWLRVNEIINHLGSTGKEYASFLIAPQSHVTLTWITPATFQIKLMGLLEVMAKDYDFDEPNYLIYKYMPTNAPQFQNTNTANSNQSNHQEQHNKQVVSIEQTVTAVEKQLQEKLSEVQLAEIAPALAAYKEEPKKWSNVEKLIKGVLGFGKDIAVGVISSVITNQMGLPR